MIGNRMTRLVFLGTIVAAMAVNAQVHIYGLRTYAHHDEYRPPIITRGEQVTIEFDVSTPQPPNLHILFRHASRDWVADENVLINDPADMRSENLFFTVAPGGSVRHTYRYINSFPNDKNFVSFPHSGNYRYAIVDRDEGDRILAEGKFIVAETAASVTMTVENIQHSEYPSPQNQMNRVTVDVAVPSEFTAGDDESIDHSEVTVVDIIKNWRLDQPERIDLNDRSSETFVENFLKPVKQFWKRDVAPGNEYRRLDLSSTAHYPRQQRAILRNQPDVSRYQWQGKPDANGASKVKAFAGAEGDYLEVEMRLRLASNPGRQIFAVGAFSSWNVIPEYEMKDDSGNGLYVLRHWVRRGVYDYQYVLGDVEDDGTIINQDWISLEGNDWRTINRYTALVYYRDRRLGGFDRVIGIVRGRSPGTVEAGAKNVSSNPLPASIVPVKKTESRKK